MGIARDGGYEIMKISDESFYGVACGGFIFLETILFTESFFLKFYWKANHNIGITKKGEIKIWGLIILLFFVILI